MIIQYQIGRILMEERLAQAERARQISRYRRDRRSRRRAAADPSPEADVIELTFGSHCGIDQIGA